MPRCPWPSSTIRSSKSRWLPIHPKSCGFALIYSYGANEEEADGILDEENSEDTSALDQSSRDFLDAAIRDYNEMFHTNYSTDGDKFQNYYKDVSLRMKNKELDLLIVVNMFLTGFDATTLNTLWVDKNLKMHGPHSSLQPHQPYFEFYQDVRKHCLFPKPAKTGGCSDCAVRRQRGRQALFCCISLLITTTAIPPRMERPSRGYVDMIGDLTEKFPLSEPRIEGERNQKEFITLFGAILRMRNLLLSFDDFKGQELISERDLQDYLGRYQDLRDEWVNRAKSEKEDITDDIVL